ncbi:MAG TPA: YfhO family protein, partial [Candidatus Tripitaka californicus]|uniref:YfhO family protein n=1 Tax=Candidatus Tripitaka californicus TaxID=3367616 RepID=UPI00402510D5
MVGASHLYDPFKLIIIGLGSLWNLNLLWVYQFGLLFQLALMAFGTYLYYREILGTRHTIYLLPLALMSAFTWNSLSSIANLDIFWHFPFILLFVTRYLKDKKFVDILLASFFTGVSFQQYHFVLLLFTLMVYILCFCYSQRQLVLQNIQTKSVFVHLCIAFLLVAALASPLLSLYLDKEEIYPFARVLEKVDPSSALVETYEAIIGSNASYGSYMDLLVMPFYSVAKNKYIGASITQPYKGHYLSETQLYIGLIPTLLFLLGLVFGRHELKRLFILMLFVSLNMFLGPQSFVHCIAYKLFPFLHANHHTQQFGTYVLFFTFFFIPLGLRCLLDSKTGPNGGDSNKLGDLRFIGYLLIAWTCGQCIYHNFYYTEVFYNHFKRLPDFNFDLVFTTSVFVWSLLPLAIYYLLILLSRRGLALPVLTLLRDNLSKAPNLVLLVILALSMYEWHIYDQLINNKKFQKVLEEFVDSRSVYTTRPVSKIKFSTYSKPYEFQNYRKKATFALDSRTDFDCFYNLEERIKINFQASIEKKVTASDWFLDTPYVPDFVEKRAVHLVYYLKDYYNIIYCKRSEDIKDKLLGAEDNVIAFYPQYIFLTKGEFDDFLQREDVEYDLENYVLIVGNGATGIKQGSTTRPGTKIDFSIRVNSYYPHNLDMDVSVNQSGFLVFRDAYHKDWKAYIDGKECNIFKANGIYKAVYMNEGNHTVVFRYTPRAYLYSLLMYFGGTLFVLVCLIV